MSGLTGGEIEFLLSDPETLERLADYHAVQETMADGMDFADCADHHKEKAENYRLMAQEALGRILLE